MVLYAINNNWRGEIFAPKISAYKIDDVVKVLAPKIKDRVIDIRLGEKNHKEMVTHSDSFYTYNI